MNLPRGCGKSTNIIIEAVETGYPVIVGTNMQKRHLERRAEEITNKRISIYTAEEFLRGKKDFKPKKVLIDELPFVLSYLLNTECEMATMTSKSLEEYYGHRDENV
nr:MAG TPA: helicase/RNA Complex, VIRAL PROTEIN-RNA complex [Caudoviricetes sp.]